MARFKTEAERIKAGEEWARKEMALTPKMVATFGEAEVMNDLMAMFMRVTEPSEELANRPVLDSEEEEDFDDES